MSGPVPGAAGGAQAPAHERFLVVDFGAQYAQLIARRVREQGCFAEIVLPKALTPERARQAKGIVLSGSPWSAYQQGAPTLDAAVFSSGTPVLGICYGMQLMTHVLGGKVAKADHREYGHASVRVLPGGEVLFAGLGAEVDVWMSHGDRVDAPAPGFTAIAATPSAPFAAVRHGQWPVYGVQFHPEVTHSPRGTELLRNFLFGVCRASGDWKMSGFVEESVARIRAMVGPDEQVICGLSGGVDSTVAAVLIHRAIGERLTCIFVDNGLLRAGEAEEVLSTFRERYHIPLRFAPAGARFLEALRGVTDPEQKRKHIGRVFVEVFEHEAREVRNARWLAQGTLYPDVIESQSAFGGASVTIKTHHNVGGLPEKMGFRLLEPFRELFKDEVRAIGRELGVPERIVARQPFPGPGLAVRVAGEVTEERLAILRNADRVVREEVEAAGADRRLWQWFAVLVPVKTVGVMGDERTYENVVAVRAVESTDGMTADWADLGRPLLARLSSRIINEVRGVNRVVYDISSKPPATIEWE
ncbi:MAG: glutamine-hydrolyzing GMP synthase [Planctomycetia bacterium]